MLRGPLSRFLALACVLNLACGIILCEFFEGAEQGLVVGSSESSESWSLCKSTQCTKYAHKQVNRHTDRVHKINTTMRIYIHMIHLLYLSNVLIREYIQTHTHTHTYTLTLTSAHQRLLPRSLLRSGTGLGLERPDPFRLRARLTTFEEMLEAEKWDRALLLAQCFHKSSKGMLQSVSKTSAWPTWQQLSRVG